MRRRGNAVCRSRGGSCRYYEARVVTCLNGFLSIVREITDCREAEEALNRSQLDVERLRRLTGMGELAASIAHDVNQPLCAIIANARAALRSHPCQSPAEENLVREALEDIVKDARRASEVIHRTRRLFVERTNAKAPVNANELIEHVVGLARRSFDAANVSVRTELAPDLPDMLADPILLRQVLLNLAMNAIDAMRESTRRELTLASSLEESGELVEIRVSDTGWGLHPEEAQEVFRAFTHTKPEGMGMGLAISRAIIAAQGGRLWATPNPEWRRQLSIRYPDFADCGRCTRVCRLRPLAVDELLKAPPVDDADCRRPRLDDRAGVAERVQRLHDRIGRQVEVTRHIGATHRQRDRLRRRRCPARARFCSETSATRSTGSFRDSISIWRCVSRRACVILQMNSNCRSALRIINVLSASIGIRRTVTGEIVRAELTYRPRRASPQISPGNTNESTRRLPVGNVRDTQTAPSATLNTHRAESPWRKRGFRGGSFSTVEISAS